MFGHVKRPFWLVKGVLELDWLWILNGVWCVWWQGGEVTVLSGVWCENAKITRINSFLVSIVFYPSVPRHLPSYSIRRQLRVGFIKNGWAQLVILSRNTRWCRVFHGGGGGVGCCLYSQWSAWWWCHFDWYVFIWRWCFRAFHTIDDTPPPPRKPPLKSQYLAKHGNLKFSTRKWNTIFFCQLETVYPHLSLWKKVTTWKKEKKTTPHTLSLKIQLF